MTNLCPQCGKELEYSSIAYMNMERYGRPCTVATDCCGKAVRLIPRMSIEAVAASNVGDTDDWGNPYSEDDL